MTRSVALVMLLALAARVLSLFVVAQPGYTDAYYYATVASRLAHGQGLTADFVWSYVEAPRYIALPVASHRFWMPLATILQAAGIVPLGGLLGDFRAGQLAIVVIAALIPLVTFAAARSLGASVASALAAAAIAGLGGAFAPAWVSVDAFAPAAVIGTAFFLLVPRAARGHVRSGILAGLATGLLYLARAEGAFFGLALLWLAGRPISRTAGVAGSAVALAIGGTWLARDAALGPPGDMIARALLLVRYDQFFALTPPTVDAFVAAPGEVVAARIGALLTNALTAAMALLLFLAVPLVVAVRRRWARPDVRAFAGLALVVYLVQSIAFAPHSVRGSYFHSLAAFFPFGVALAAAGADDLLATARLRLARLAAVIAFAIVSVFAVAQWDVDFNTAYRARLAAAPLVPAGPIVVADAAAWRWITGRTAVLAPSEGPDQAACIAQVYLADALVLEPAHFASYEGLYASERSDLFTRRADANGIRIYSPPTQLRCILAAR